MENDMKVQRFDSLPLDARILTGEGDPSFALPESPEPGYSAVAPHVAQSLLGLLGLLDELELPAHHQPQGEALRERKHAASNGVLVVSFAMDKRGKIVSDIDVRGIGLPGDEDRPLGDILDDLAERAEQAVRKLKGEALDDELVVEQAVSRALKKASQQIWDRRPIVETVILRL